MYQDEGTLSRAETYHQGVDQLSHAVAATGKLRQVEGSLLFLDTTGGQGQSGVKGAGLRS
jgi:hypothetical protein